MAYTTTIDKERLLLCPICGTQSDNASDDAPPDGCRICNDPRQYVPAAGQQWTSLSAEQGKHTNKWQRLDGYEGRLWSLWAEPKLGIGQRAILIETDEGNVLWDCIAYISPELVDFIRSRGGLKAIIISHPHFYSTHLTWASIFNCPVYVHAADAEWLSREDRDDQRKLIRGATEVILPGVTAIQCGGHFPGSMVLHWNEHLFISDTFVNVPAGFTPPKPHAGMNSYAFMWSIPNMVPLTPDDIQKIWDAIKGYDFTATHGLFVGWDLQASDIKGRVLDSMKNQVKKQGFTEASVFLESWP